METTPLQALLRDKDMRLADLARSIGVDKATVTRWSRGTVPTKHIVEVERVTGIPREKLRPDLYVQAFNAPLNDIKHVKPAASRDG